jgi:hypothetical protein
LWHEVKGEVGWLILSRHKPPWSARSYLTKEKKRLQEGFAKLEARMKDLGAARDASHGGGYYKAAGNAKEASPEIETTQSNDTLLHSYNIELNEMYNFEIRVATLDRLLEWLQSDEENGD